MEYDFSNILNELLKLVKYRSHYDRIIILHCLECIRIINNMDSGSTIQKSLLKGLKYLSPFLNCYIDFKQLNHIYNEKLLVYPTVESLSISSVSSDDLMNRINEIVDDSNNIVLKIVKIKELFRNNFELVKKTFKVLDHDNNDYISCKDLLKVCKNQKVCNDLVDLIIELIIENDYDDVHYDEFCIMFEGSD